MVPNVTWMLVDRAMVLSYSGIRNSQASRTGPRFSHISGMGDPGKAESAISSEIVSVGRPEYVISSESVPPGGAKDAILSGSVAPGEPNVAPVEPKVEPGEPRERFPRIFKVIPEYFRCSPSFRSGGSVELKYKPNI